jgi:cytidyltransferase-like protein
VKKRIMVDMSATLFHHGHIRLLKKASDYGDVVVGLTSDKEVISNKGYVPELLFKYRKEILESIKYVSEVVETNWLIDQKTLDKHNIDLLVHGDDNSNAIDNSNLIIFERTEGISSSEIRSNSLRVINEINNQKLMLTPGPAAVLHDNLKYIKPLFGRGDNEYDAIAKSVADWVKKLSGQDEVVWFQGSATIALEIAAHTFVKGKVLLISTGYYSDRLEKLLPKSCDISIIKYEDLKSVNEKYDWVLCAYTETSIAFKVDLKAVKNKSLECGAKLYVDATGSIGLEENHYLADVLAFSSCKGLFGLTGACFIAHKSNLNDNRQSSELFYFNLDTQKNKMVTGPYHAIASLYGVIENHDLYRERVIQSKKIVLERWKSLVRDDNQPLLCTYIEGEIAPNDQNIVLYSPRSELSGSVICHFGEIHSDEVNICNRVNVISS